MNEPLDGRIWFAATLVGLALTVRQGCRKNQATPVEATISWNSQKMREIEKEWQSLQDADHGTRDKGDKLRHMVDRLFKERLSEQDLRQLAASCDTLPARVEDWGFNRSVLVFIIKSFVELGDRESLVKLLSTRCPSRIEWPENIEYCLAFRGKGLKYPILVLGEAYSMSQVPETRHVLAAAVRRSFAGLGIRGEDDADFVKNAIQRYETEKDQLIVSSDYLMNEMTGCFTVERYEQSPELYDDPSTGHTRYPLFVEKSTR